MYEITIASWQHDFKLVLERTRTVLAAQTCIAEQLDVHPAQVFILAGQAFLDPALTFLEQGVVPGQTLQFTLSPGKGVCGHRQPPAGHC